MMKFEPEQFEGAALLDLVRALAGRDERAVVAGLEEHARQPTSRSRGGTLTPSIEWRTTRFPCPETVAGLTVPMALDVAAADVVLEEYLAGGTQGAVYSGRVRSTGLVVAVKVIHGAEVRDEGAALREARIAAKLRHRNILRVFEARKAGAFWVVVMEFLQGEDLAHVPPPPELLKPALGQLADAVLALARARVVHRDLKPANIILRRGDHVPVVVDFGLAIDLETWTGSEGFGGTPLFMAPEAFSDDRPEPAWDAYALGMTAAALTVGNQLPRSSSLSELRRLKIKGDFDRKVIGLLPDIPDEALRDWCVGLLGEPAGRLSVLEQACSWTEADVVV